MGPVVKTHLFVLFLGILVAANGADARIIRVSPSSDVQEKLQTALLDAKPGDVVRLAAGRFRLTEGLSLDVADVTIQGTGPRRTVLDFSKQKGEAEGLLITSNGATVRDLAMENPKGNGMKAKGVDRLSFINLLVRWTGGPKATNGAYCFYPVSSTNVLIDRVTAIGASDTGIYVGQSRNIVIENSHAEFNVAGIEIENSYNADVHDNVTTHNAGGVLVFDLPDLPQMGGHSTRVFRNQIVNNDTPNFAAKGNIVSNVPTGTGVMILANRDVHVFANRIDGNASGAILLVSYPDTFTDTRYDPLPRDVAVHSNTIGRNGFAPEFAGGAKLAKALGGNLPPVVWNGETSYPRAGQAEPVDEDVRMNIADGPVANLNLKLQGTPIAKAEPAVTRTLKLGSIAEPAPVTLPDEQRRLERTR